MKRILAALGLILLLVGCGSENVWMNQAMKLRNGVLGKSCNFQAKVTADYGDSFYTFGLDCKMDSEGDMCIAVTEPETISGITARISKETGQLTFDDQALVFELVAEGQITPICAPWLFMKALRSGYISSCGKDSDGICIRIDDSFAGTQFCIEIWTGADGIPSRAEIIWQGRRIVSIDINAFVIV